MRRRRAVVVVLLALALRLILAFTTQGNYDMRSYEVVKGIAARGGNVYAETHRYNYSPVWFGVLNALPDPIHVSARVLVSVADVANGIIIGAIAGAKARTFYLFNPLSILLVGYGGQFEALAVTPLLLALRFPALLWPLATVAIVIKHDVAFLAWMLYVYTFPGWRAWLAMAATGLVFLATFIPYLPNGAGGILRNVFLYQSITGVYGFGALLPGAFVLFVGVMLALPYAMKRAGLPVHEAFGVQAVAQIATMPGMGDQYWVLVPLASALRLSRWGVAFALIGSVVVLGLPWSVTAEWVRGWPYELRLMNIVWFVSLAWLASYFVEWKRDRTGGDALPDNVR
jgi:hypothetical protein